MVVGTLYDDERSWKDGICLYCSVDGETNPGWVLAENFMPLLLAELHKADFGYSIGNAEGYHARSQVSVWRGRYSLSATVFTEPFYSDPSAALYRAVLAVVEAAP